MPGLRNRATVAVEPANGDGIWSRHRGDITFEQLQKFWSELLPESRRDLVRIDKQMLFEHARKNLYCSRCNGLLLEGFSQIIMYGKSSHQEGCAEVYHSNITLSSEAQKDKESDDMQDPSVHPWGGLSATREGMLTLLECFLNAKSLITIQNVFDSARARERERELLYPDACGGGGRGWISQGMSNYGRGHGTRETCALHTARLSVDTLVDFWSALSDEMRFSLLRMKEEDFIERLMYRFDNKRFCRDCRRNVIREFKELKELKRMRREPQCTNWFCVADTAFQYEVSEDAVLADWHQSFTDAAGTYHHFEWAIGTADGKSDILDFEDVGMSGQVQVDGLDLDGLTACFITLRAWKLDGRCTELSVKAHALKGQACVHRRLVVGDGFVTITKGESIRTFFEHAEEAEEEEDDDALEKDGNEYDGDGSRPQKHAKSPELAREFLLDAATVIFKEQVEKAFREGTARQNAHSIFVCLALKLLEERVHVACKEIITLEKQCMLLEEEEKEKREKEQRKERRRTKEREKKLRRKERIKGKERGREIIQEGLKLFHDGSEVYDNEFSASFQDESPNSIDSGDSISDAEDNLLPAKSLSNVIVKHSSNVHLNEESMGSDCMQHRVHTDAELNPRDLNDSSIIEQPKSSRWKLKFNKDLPVNQASQWYDKHHSAIDDDDVNLQQDECRGHRVPRGNAKNNARSCNLKFNNRIHYEFNSCGCNWHADYRGNANNHSTIRSSRDIKAAIKNREINTLCKKELSDMSRPIYRTMNGAVPKGKITGVPGMHKKQVWEPMDARKKCVRSMSDPDLTLKAASEAHISDENNTHNDDKDFHGDPTLRATSETLISDPTLLDQPDECGPSGLTEVPQKDGASNSYPTHENHCNQANGKNSNRASIFCSISESNILKKDGGEEVILQCPSAPFNIADACDSLPSSSSSDNCSSCLSEGDSGTSSSSAQNADSSSTSDYEDASQHSEEKGNPSCNGGSFHPFKDDALDNKLKLTKEDQCLGKSPMGSSSTWSVMDSSTEKYTSCHQVSGNTGLEYDAACRERPFMPIHNQNMHMPVFSSSTVAYRDQNTVSWSGALANGYMHYPHLNHYMFPSPVGYGLTANRPSDFCMRYAPVQPTPLYGIQQPLVYQSSNGLVSFRAKEETETLKVCGTTQHVNENMMPPPEQWNPPLRPCLNWQSKRPKDGGVVDLKPCRESASFSFFHYGGPFAGSTGGNANPSLSKYNDIQSDLTCSKQEVAEYCLFSANNSTRFTFF